MATEAEIAERRRIAAEMRRSLVDEANPVSEVELIVPKSAEPVEEGPAGTVIKCVANGPLLVEPPIQVLDVDGNVFDAPVRPNGMVALCRCGMSGLKPFCDGSHRKELFSVRSGFQSAPKVPAE